MTSNPNTAPADACSPDADRAGPAMPENIAQLLYVVRILLQYGRHLAATIEHRAAAPGFGLFAAVFGTAKLPVILAYLHRGILRATALESLLLKRAATGRDVAATLPRIRATSGAPSTDPKADPVQEPIAPQIERLAAERAQHDAPIDPNHLPTLEQIEAEVRDHPIGRNFADICRDFGILPGLCTSQFWGAITQAIACHEGSVMTVWEDLPRRSAQLRQERQEDPESKQPDLPSALHPEKTLGFRVGEPPVVPFHAVTMPPARPHDDATASKQPAAAPPEATGPPAAMQLAA
jgi:hypothetical protein